MSGQQNKRIKNKGKQITKQKTDGKSQATTQPRNNLHENIKSTEVLAKDCG